MVLATAWPVLKPCRRALCLAFVLCLPWCASACAPAIDVHAITFPAADLSGYATFSFGTTNDTPPEYVASSRSTEVKRRVHLYVEAILAEKGYVQKLDGTGDFIVQIATGRREREELASVPPLPHPRPTRPAWFEEHEEKELLEGILIIDALDGRTQAVVWHGAAHVELDPEKIDEALLKRATMKVLAAFPARRAAPPAP
jgi:hypothetical protein